MQDSSLEMGNARLLGYCGMLDLRAFKAILSVTTSAATEAKRSFGIYLLFLPPQFTTAAQWWLHGACLT